MMRIIQGDFSDPRVVDLPHIHLTTARAGKAPGIAHALDLTGLQSPDISFWTIWDDETLLGVGALKRLSMFDFGLGRGLEHLTAEELAEFFGTFCPFCKSAPHNPDSL